MEVRSPDIPSLSTGIGESAENVVHFFWSDDYAHINIILAKNREE